MRLLRFVAPGPGPSKRAAVTIPPAPRWGAVADWKTLRPLLYAALATAAAGALAAFGYVQSGLYNAGAAKPHTTFTEWVTHETMIHSVRRHSQSIVPPSRFTAAQVIGGFCTYESHCVACHGAAAVPRERWVSGLEPAPPYLLDAAQKWRTRELFWIAKNGIKMTGMPSWRDNLSDAQLWEVVAWLEASAKLPPQTYVRWRSKRRCGLVMPAPFPG